MASLSLSQSIQSSLILQHYYYGRRQQEDVCKGAVQTSGNIASHTASRSQIGLGQQILLTAIFFGMSCTIEFEGLYSVMSMEYFGLPVALVSIPGLVSGTTSIFILPLLGHISDRGPDPKIPNGGQESEPSQDSTGKMISTISVALPAASICMSSLIGPLMDATGTAWAPIYYAVAVATASVLAGGIQFFL